MYNHFNNLYSGESVENTPTNDTLFDNISDDYLDQNFTEIEVKNAVFSQTNGKSAGSDHLITKIFKNSFDIIGPFLTALYNTVFNEGCYPESWGEGIIVPIFKGGNFEPKNFRGITLNNIISKIYSKLLVTRLDRWSQMHTKIIDNQYGFQKGKSTIDCIFILHSLIMKTLSRKKKLYVAFLDWEKMFDRVDRTYLFQKLLSEQVSSKFVKSIRSMYNKVRSTVRYRSEYSDFINSNIGVKQGDPASSILCLFLLNDILNHINSNVDGIISVDEIQLFLLLFADDAAVFTQDPQSLQLILNDIEQYCNMWKLKLNVNKTKIMILENGRHTNYDFFLYNTRVEVVKSFKYLGVYLHKNGKWNRTQSHIAQNASFSLHKLFTTFYNLELPISNKVDLFEKIVEPVLNYAAEVWGHHQGSDVESILTKFCRKILVVKKSSNLDALYGELGKIPLKLQRKLITLKYWVKLLNSDRDSILYKIYNTLKNDSDNEETYNNNNWAHHIKRILNECGLYYLWQNQSNMNVSYDIIRQRVLDMYYQSWYSGINNCRRLETYSLFKHEFKFERYLDFINDNRFRSALTSFRVSSHKLQIERGRHLNIPRNERICRNCNSNMTENEYHFLLICPKYSDLRNKYIKRYYFTWPTIQKFTNLMSKNSKFIVNNLSKFIYFASLRRI